MLRGLLLISRSSSTKLHDNRIGRSPQKAENATAFVSHYQYSFLDVAGPRILTRPVTADRVKVQSSYPVIWGPYTDAGSAKHTYTVAG